MKRKCMNCGNPTGPFDRYFVGFRKTGQWVFYCPTERKLPAEKRAAQSQACNNRREKSASA